mgnify:CR=1 FL=1
MGDGGKAGDQPVPQRREVGGVLFYGGTGLVKGGRSAADAGDVLRAAPLPPLHGGAQERGKRGGTENVASIVGLAAAMERACATMEERRVKLTAMRDKLIDGLLKIPRCRLNGDRERRAARQRELLLPGGGR